MQNRKHQERDDSDRQRARVIFVSHASLCGAAALTTFFVFFAAPASAYLEPGTATYVIQTVVAAVFSSLYLVKLNWQRLKTFFRARFGRDAEDADSQ